MSVVPLSPQPASSAEHDNTSVRVCLRVRPLLPYEQTVNAQKVLSYPNPNQLSLNQHGNHHAFTFDYVFDDFSTQSAVYSAAIQPLVDSFLSGYNTTILAYGQTGSGKTHTMGTAASAGGMADDGAVGIIPRVIRDIFRCVHERETTHMHTVKVSFLEIYNEEIKDLLNAQQSAHTPQPYIREGPNNSILVANSIEEVVATAQDTLTALIRGSQCRVVGSTAMNATSSRSHAIFSIILSQRKLSPPQGDAAASPTTSTASPADAVLAASGDDEVIQSKFHFVDLAGSERLKRTGAVGDRMKEGININQGLLALGNCISALGGATKAGHVPFRDSKITRMLQDSLGGNSKTLMIACVSPADVNADETVNTLKYANRAKNIKNKPIINRDPNSAKIEALRARMGVLEHAVGCFRQGDAARAEEVLRSVDEVGAGGGMASPSQAGGRGSIGGGNGGSGMGGVSAEEVSSLRDQNLVLEAELRRLSERMKGLRDEMSGMSDKLVQAETDRDVMRLRLEKAKSGDTKEDTAEGEEAEVSVLADNRRTMARMGKKIAHQKRQLDSAMKLINSYAIDGLPTLATDSASTAAGGGSARKKRRNHRRRTNPSVVDGGAEAGGLQQRVDEEAAAEESSDDGQETDVSLVLADEQTLDEDDSADDAPPASSLDLSDADSADEQTDTLALLAELKGKEHDAAMRQWTAEGVRLTADLTSKTKAVKDFQAQSANVLHLRVQYEARITEMEREMEAVQQERDRVLRELEQSRTAEADKSEYERQYEQAVRKYREQLSSLSTELRATREKLKENERMKRQLAADEQRIRRLEAEIGAAKKAKVQLAKKMEDSAVRYREWCEMKDNKLKSMVKESRKQSILLKKMESEYAKQSIVLQRRNEEKAALEKKVKVSQQQQQQAGSSGAKALNSARSNASSSSQPPTNRRSPPSNALRPPRATPARRPASRRHRDSPSARAKAMASNAAALSDSAAPQHPSTAGSAASDELLKSAIEQEIATAVERASRAREIDDWKGKLAGLQTQLLAVQDAMMNNPMQTAAQQSEYSHAEQECARIQSSLASMEHTVAMKEAELGRLMPPSASPLKGSKSSTATHPASSPTGGKRGAAHEEESVFLSGSSVDYRMFSRIRVLSLDASKRALVYLIHQAVQSDCERIEMRRELERLQRRLDDDRRHGEERERLVAQRRKEEAVMRSLTFTMSPLQAMYDDLPRDELQLSPSARPRRTSSPTPASPASPHPAASFTYQPPPVYSPPLTNNFLSSDEHNTTFIEIDHSGSATALHAHSNKPQSANSAAAAAVAKKGANVFARLTDTNSFTGMYKSIAEEKRQKVADTRPRKPVFQQPNKRHFDQLKGGSATQPLSTASALLSWPPLATLTHSTSANSLSHSATAALPSSSSSAFHPSSHSSSPTLGTVDLHGKPAGSVFSRLTNPQLYTGAQRARFMDAQTKAHSRVIGELDSSGRPARVASPPRTHSRQPSSSELPLSVTYDALSAPALPSIADEDNVVHVGAALDDSGSADDFQYVQDIRRGISLSVDTAPDGHLQQQPSDGEQGLITPPEELLSPTAAPVFHFSAAPGDDDKENSQSYGQGGGSGDTSPSSKQQFQVHGDVEAGRGLGDEESLSEASRPTHNYNLRSGSQGQVSGS